MARRCEESKLMLCLVDDSPSPEIAESFRSLGSHVFKQSHPGMGSSRRQAYFFALEMLKSLSEESAAKERVRENRCILWLEPEKDDLILYVEKICTPILNGVAEVVVPFRTDHSWLSYPDHQRNSEGEGLRAFAELTGRDDLDVYFGPVACSEQAAISYVLTPDPRAEGIADTYVPQYIATRALADGLTGSVVPVPVDFLYPLEQKREEESNLLEAMLQKRADQLQTVSNAHARIMKLHQAKYRKEKKVTHVTDEQILSTEFLRFSFIVALFCGYVYIYKNKKS